MIKKISIFIMIWSAALFALVACSGDADPNSENKGTLELTMPPWVNSPPQAWLAKLVIEQNLGWNVNITEADIGMAYASTANGTSDFFVDAWIPSHNAFIEEHQESIEVLDHFSEVDPSGLVVPSYVDIDSIEDLDSVAGKFNGKIIGIEPGAGIMETTTKAMETYGLDNFELTEGSDFAMTAALSDAIDFDEWIVVTGWNPHWMFSKFDLKYLEDPEQVYGDGTIITTVINKDMRDKAPEVVEFLNKMEIDSSIWDDLINEISVNGADPEATVQEWIDNNQDLVEAWLE